MQSKWFTDFEVNELQLIANFKNGDLHDNELNYLLSHITKYIRRSHNSLYSEAEDVASEAVVKAYDNINGLKDDALFFAWVKGIARHVVLHRLRELKQLPLQSRDALLGTTNDESPKEVQALQEQVGFDDEAWLRTTALKEAFASLSEEQQVIIALRIDEQKPSKEVAVLLNLSDANVRQKEVRACRKMREYLTLNGYADLFPTGTRRCRQPAKPVPAASTASLSAGA